MKLIIEFIISALAVAIAAYITPGVTVDGPVTALIVAVVLALVNLTLGLVLRTLTAPLNFLTFGLISFLITGVLVLVVDKFVDGFSVSSYFIALVFAVLLGLIKSAFGFAKK